jgi:N-acetylglucosamine kinase-like BadF-type ATPase
MKILTLFFIFLTCVSLHASDYILCIDGGGSKTLLQVIDREGKVLPLFKNNVKTDQLIAAGSNINSVGKEGVRAALHALFEGVKIGDEQKELHDIISECRIVAGMAGVGAPENKSIVSALFEECGVKKDRIHLLTDAEAALQLVEDKGMILISGTGSICLGKKEGSVFRVGGLGKVLGDEGSGYHIGLEAFKAAMEEEYGWGKPTSLTSALKEVFGVAEVRSLIRQINLGELTSAKIGSVAPLVFEKAAEKDEVAETIIQHTAEELRHLLTKMSKIANLSHCEVHLWGGIFKSVYADALIQKIFEDPALKQAKLTIVNKARNNAALLYAQRFILSRKG